MSDPGEMAHRVAQALFFADNEKNAGRKMTRQDWEDLPVWHKDVYSGLARAAIQEMREPTEEMVKAAEKRAKEALHSMSAGARGAGLPGTPVLINSYPPIYQAMIDEALR